MIRALCKVWRDRYPYNLIRSSYYFARYRFKDFGISIPDRIRTNVSACVGWPAKAVRALADLSVFDGWDLGGIDPYGVDELTDETSLELAIPQTIVSAYMHGCAFLTITKDAEGIIVTPRSAEYSAAIWDGRHNRLAAVLTINDATSKGRITAFNVFLPNKVYAVVRNDRGRWEAGRIVTNWPEPTADPDRLRGHRQWSHHLAGLMAAAQARPAQGLGTGHRSVADDTPARTGDLPAIPVPAHHEPHAARTPARRGQGLHRARRQRSRPRPLPTTRRRLPKTA